MKTFRTLTLSSVLFLTLLIGFSCSKKDVIPAKAITSEVQTGFADPVDPIIVLVREPWLLGTVRITAPTTININTPFSIVEEVTCGRVGMERAYTLAADGVTKIYNGLTCETPGLQWEPFLALSCYTTGASWTGSFSLPGTYVFRTKHLATDAGCDGQGGGNKDGDCDFTGTEMNCFTIEAVDACVSAFTGQAISCDYEREAVYTFKSKNALSYVKIQGGLTNFTGEDAIVYISGGDLTVSQSMPGGSSNRTITIEGSVGACENITIHLSWSSTNSGGVITGSWSATGSAGMEVMPPVPGLTCSN